MSSDISVIQTTASRSFVAVRFRDVTKTFRLYQSNKQRLRAAFSRRVAYKTVTAVNDLSFTINRGESVALIGRNGAGKTTALKIITGVTTPDSGLVEIHGRVSALLGLSAGFDSRLTGRENLQLRGRLWGLSSTEINEKMDAIVEFAELGSYIDQPIRTYSSGMRARLGFAFASSLDPDILILDEVLSVGDRSFHRKSLAKMKEILAKHNLTLLFVTHSFSSAKQFCERGIVIDAGTLLFDGPIEEAIAFYEEMTD
ncbi:MAG: ABC transporter ATP-binding protein [Propionibacteriaceae bacterium]|jgi:teichoic acid transport system ATP-binding protein|nr:ABC transporter ATP-binding protein [Propionibacteriaceae bacterium]